MRLETKRLIMRNFDVSDINEAYKYLSDEDTMYYIEDPYTIEDTKQFIERYGLCEEPFVYALVEKHSKTVIGHIIFHKADCDDIYEIGCIISKEFQHKGFAYEIISSLINYSFRNLKLHKIMAETIEVNTNCINLLNKLGFKQEGVLRKHNWDHGIWVDEHYYGLLCEEVNL